MGPIVSARIEQVLAVQEMLRTAGEPIPSVSVQALIDTGASGTTVQSSVLHGFDIQPIGRVSLSTPTTLVPEMHLKYRLRIVLSQSIAFETDVVEAPMGGQHVQCLIGRDILDVCRFVYDGPKRQFVLTTFPINE
jgi:hypothetical protein